LIFCETCTRVNMRTKTMLREVVRRQLNDLSK